MASYRKRKRPGAPNTRPHVGAENEQPTIDHQLFLQLHEADIIRGPQAKSAAQSLEIYDYESISESKPIPKQRIGDALIRWGGSQLGMQASFPGDDMDNVRPSGSEKDPIWVDRYVTARKHHG